TELCERTGYAARTVLKHLVRMQNLLVATRAVMTVHHECPQCQARPGERCTVNGRPVTRRAGAHQHARRIALARARATTPHYRARPGSLVAAAKALGCWGVTASRARRYAVEIELYRWWRQEEQWMRSPKAGVRTGVQTHPEQGALVLTTLLRQPRRRYPRTADGRGDHAAARARIERRIATA
ncbi:zinc finger domain-containing protein, partial [Streptomyces sp. NPDC055607]